MKKLCLALGLVGGMTIASALPGEVPFEQLNSKYSHQITSIASGDWGSVWIGGDNGAIARVDQYGSRTYYTNPFEPSTAIKFMSFGSSGNMGCVGVVYTNNAIYRLCTPDTSKGDGVGWDKNKWESIRNTYTNATPTALGMLWADGGKSVNPLVGFSDGKILQLLQSGTYNDYSNPTSNGAVISLHVDFNANASVLYSNGEVYGAVGEWGNPMGWKQISYHPNATSVANGNYLKPEIAFNDGGIIIEPSIQVTNPNKYLSVKQLGWFAGIPGGSDFYKYDCSAALYIDGSVYKICGLADTWNVSNFWKFVAWGI